MIPELYQVQTIILNLNSQFIPQENLIQPLQKLSFIESTYDLKVSIDRDKLNQL